MAHGAAPPSAGRVDPAGPAPSQPCGRDAPGHEALEAALSVTERFEEAGASTARPGLTALGARPLRPPKAF